MKNLIKNKVEMRNQLKVEDLVIGKLYKVKIPDEIVMEGSYKPELWDVAKFSNYNKEMESLFFPIQNREKQFVKYQMMNFMILLMKQQTIEIRFIQSNKFTTN